MTSCTWLGICRVRPLATAAATMAAATTCCEACSNDAARRQNLIGDFVWCRLDRNETRAPNGQSAGLVEQHRVRLRQSVERGTALDDYAAASCLGDAGDEGDGRRKYERARSGDDQDGKSPDGVARQNHAKPATRIVTGSKSNA